MYRVISVLVAAVCAGLLVCAPAHASTAVGPDVVGTTGYYDYSPSVIQTGTQQDFWWCGDQPGHTVDTILHERKSDPSHVAIAEHAVLQEGPAGSWDDTYTCNPDVIEGTFVNPLGDGVTYTYAMYYVGFGSAPTADNQIGVAFSSDGDSWTKYPGPVITSPYSGVYYGAAQPNVSYVGGVLTMVYEYQEGPNQHIEATSTDGVHFTVVGTVTASGLRRARLSWVGHSPRVGGTFAPLFTSTWGGAAYDTSDGKWYVAVNDDPFRPVSTTGGVQERGQSGVTLYSTTDLLAGTWTQLDTVDTALTGYEDNFIAGILRAPDGTVYQQPGGIWLYVSTSYPRPAYNAGHAQLGQSAAFNNWDIGSALYTPGSPLRQLIRVHHNAQHDTAVSGGWYDPYYTPESINLGSVYEAPTGDATVPLYLCKAFTTDYIPTTSSGCFGQALVGLLGYIFATPGANRIAVYRCTVPNIGDMLSLDPACEGQQVDGLLGYTQGP